MELFAGVDTIFDTYSLRFASILISKLYTARTTDEIKGMI